MIKKTVRLGILFAIGFSFFLASFFDIIPLHPLIAGLLLYSGMMLRSVSNGAITVRSRHKWRIIGIIFALIVIITLTTNLYLSLSFFIFICGVVFTFRDMNYYKNKVLRFNLRGYCIFGGYAMIYFMGFSVAANIIGRNATLDFNCDNIYKYYKITSEYISQKPSTTFASYPPNFIDKLSNNIKTTLIKTPGLYKLYNKIEGYRKELNNTVVDQQQINREVCTLVFEKIHEVYDSGHVKIGLVFLIGLFLYPFFIILIYIYGLITLALFRICISLGYFRFTKRNAKKISLE